MNAPTPAHLRAVRPERPGDRVDCTCLRARHEHGTIHAYRSDGCRCLSCRAAQAQARRAWEKQRHVGRADSAVSADRVRAHVLELMRVWDVTGPDIARAAGVASPTVYRLRDGAQTVRRSTGAALLRVRVEDLPPDALISAHGVRRRLQALAVLGWPAAEIARRVDYPKGARLMGLRRTHVHVHNAVAAVYREIITSGEDPRRTLTPAAVTVTQQKAHARGWAGPMHWGDIDRDGLA